MEKVWIATVQQMHFPVEIATLGKCNELSKGRLLLLHPYVDEEGLLHVGGIIHHSMEFYNKWHPFVVPSKHHVTKTFTELGDALLLHAGPTLVAVLLARSFAIVGNQQAVHDVTRRCMVCHPVMGEPCPQLNGCSPASRLRP